MNIVDSSGWIEHFRETQRAEFFSPAIEQPQNILIPSICIYEVHKKIAHDVDEPHARQAVALMSESQIIVLDSEVAVCASQISRQYKLGMADAIILATTRAYNAQLWTQDTDFEQFVETDNVKYFAK